MFVVLCGLLDIVFTGCDCFVYLLLLWIVVLLFVNCVVLVLGCLG